MSKRLFFHLIEEISCQASEPVEGADENAEVEKTFDEELFTQITTAFTNAFDSSSADPFKGDLENPIYKRITDGIRAFNPDNYPAPVDPNATPAEDSKDQVPTESKRSKK